MPTEKEEGKQPRLKVDILSLYPKYFDSPIQESLLSRAIQKNILALQLIDLRDYADGPRGVDDRPYGGGPGMLLKPEPIYRALKEVASKEAKVIYLSPQGRALTPKLCKELAGESHLVLLCGHYEGIDQRIIDSEVDMELSIGDYVLTNGCLASLVLLDSLSRFVPDVLGNVDTPYEDSFEKELLDHPHYTRPENFRGMAVPELLLKGNHQAVNKWRRQKALEKTKLQRQDLYARYLAKGCKQAFTLHLEVQDIKKVKKFYLKTLGFVQEEESETSHLSYGGLQLKLIEKPGAYNKQDRAYYQLQLKPFDYERLAKRLKKRPYETLIIKDPEGNPWILQAPSPIG